MKPNGPPCEGGPDSESLCSCVLCQPVFPRLIPPARRTLVVPALYVKTAAAIKGEIGRLGLAHAPLGELIGMADRSIPKYFAPETSSGRIANWWTFQSILDGICPDGFRLDITPVPGPKIAEFLERYDRTFPRSRHAQGGAP